MEATLTADGQISLPEEVRKRLHLVPGDRVKISLEGDRGVFLSPVLPISCLRGILKGRKDKALSVEEMDGAIAAEATSRYRRSFGDE